MRLSRFIVENLDAILQEWEDFARSLRQGPTMSIEALRDDAAEMLRFVAADMESEQTRQEEIAKALGRGPSLPLGQSSAAEQHGDARAVERFSLVELVSEYRALRASVMRMWLDAVPLTKESVAQIVRFNEGIDQILAEGVAKFTERLDQEADLFTASIGHDLSNPVNTVMTSTHLLAITDLSDSQRAAVERIERASERLSGMLVDLREFTRTRLGGLLLVNREPCDIADLIHQVVGELQPVHPDRHIELECQGNLVLMADRKRISQVLSNLVANALQHSPRNTDVHVRANREADAVTIEVHNAGPAIPPDLLKRVFAPLSREGRSDDGHLGLGLYIAEQIARAHGGEISVESSADAGTRFTVRLPSDG
jgi:signal transduction histidine kinase